MSQGPMTPDTRIDIDVQVLMEGHWRDGVLHHWRQREGRWEGWVRWSAGLGQNHLDWVDQDDIRQA